MAATEGVRNRDIPKLMRVRWALMDVEAAERRRDWLQDRLFNITQKITGMPGGGRRIRGIDADLADIEEHEAAYSDMLKKFLLELDEAERILKGIRYPNLRSFVVMKYVMDRSDREIMGRMRLGRRAVEDMRRRVEEAESMADVEWRD